MSNRIPRRTAVTTMALGAISAAVSGTVRGEDVTTSDRVAGDISITGEPHPDLKPFDNLMTSFLNEHRVPGAALAVARHGRLVYARGFGLADVEATRPVQPDSLFRIASISKPLTSVAVMQLVETEKLSLEQPIFDVLPATEWLAAEGKFDERLKRITIRQLLQHTGGWDRGVSFDPIGRAREMARLFDKPLPMRPSDVVRYTLTLPSILIPGRTTPTPMWTICCLGA